MQPLQLYSHRDFSAFAAYTPTAAIKMSQLYLYFIHIQSYSHKDFSVFVVYIATTAIKMSQLYDYIVI